jgi:hypothetical protein
MRILREGIRKKTRRIHECCKCDNLIPKGSECHFQVNDGGQEWDFGTCYWHKECNDADFPEY